MLTLFRLPNLLLATVAITSCGHQAKKSPAKKEAAEKSAALPQNELTARSCFIGKDGADPLFVLRAENGDQETKTLQVSSTLDALPTNGMVLDLQQTLPYGVAYSDESGEQTNLWTSEGASGCSFTFAKVEEAGTDVLHITGKLSCERLIAPTSPYAGVSYANTGTTISGFAMDFDCNAPVIDWDPLADDGTASGEKDGE